MLLLHTSWGLHTPLCLRYCEVSKLATHIPATASLTDFGGMFTSRDTEHMLPSRSMHWRILYLAQGWCHPFRVRHVGGLGVLIQASMIFAAKCTDAHTAL
jgi:hypothetical protein